MTITARIKDKWQSLKGKFTKPRGVPFLDLLEQKGYTVNEVGTIIPINFNDGEPAIATDVNIRTISSVRAALASKCNPISMMEIMVFQRVKGIKVKRPDHPVMFLNRNPNNYTTRNKWFSTAV